MTATGRLTTGPGPRTRRTVYGDPGDGPDVGGLFLTSQVDLAHVVMLREQELISDDAARALLLYITDLRKTGFERLRGLPAPRGGYLMYEGHLIDALGPEVGGVLHTARSRNDLGATTTAIRLRDWLLEFVEQTIRLQVVLLSRARAHRHVTMPVYTHFQAAMPVTYGYYLTGVALALERDLRAVRDAAADLRRSPLGACAVAGTALRIDTSRTAGLLGFDAPPAHAVDAVACRDTMLRLLGLATGVAVTLSRLAVDLQLWSTAEFGFLHFPERLVGSSSAMPQKRNPFLLEHVKAKAGTALGAWSAAAATTKSTPFTNTIEVGTEAVGSMWPGLRAIMDAVTLSQVLVSGARPVPERMAARARDGFVTATAVADGLVRAGVPFRAAHHAVGQAVREADESGVTGLPELAVRTDAGVVAVTAPAVDDVVAATRFGGGPGSIDPPMTTVHAALRDHTAWLRERRARVDRAEGELTAAVDAVLEERGNGR